MSASIAYDLIGRDKSASKTFDKVGNSAQKAGGKFAGLGKIIAGSAIGTGLAQATGAAVRFGFSAVKAASDANETLSKSNVIFGKNAVAMEKWASGGARTMGLSKQAALDAASGFGDMFSQIGFSGDQAAKMSKSVVQMSADLGSFNNLETSDVSERMSAAFRGEYDSLQALIPNINAARVESEAMAKTGKKNATELTAQEKAAAVLAIVHKDGSRAMGDFARTSGGLANQSKILKAQLSNTSAEIGTKLLPVVTKGAVFLNDKLGPAMAKAGDWAEKNLLPPLTKVGNFIKDRVIPAVKDLAGKWLTGLKGGFENIGKSIQKNKPFIDGLKVALQKIGEFVLTKVMPAIGKLYMVAFPALGKAIGIGITVVAKLSSAFLGFSQAGIKAFRFVLNAAFSAFSGILGAAARGLGWIPGIGPKIKAANKSFKEFRDKTVANLDAAAAAAGRMKAVIDGATKPRTIRVGIQLTGAGMHVSGQAGPMFTFGQPSQNARGTTSWRGGLTTLNEKGDEIVDLPSGSRVYTARQSARMEARATSGGLDPKAIGKAVAEALKGMSFVVTGDGAGQRAFLQTGRGF